jgi:hypothetical protein
MIKFLMCLLLSSQIVVSDQIPIPVKYPASVYQMTDAQFYDWAVSLNLKAKESLSKDYEPQWLQGSGTDTNISGYNNGFYNSGQYWHSRQSQTYPRYYLNPNYIGPGPLIIINPYCRPTYKPERK